VSIHGCGGREIDGGAIEITLITAQIIPVSENAESPIPIDSEMR
jgi:hypothetical protein